MPEYTLPLKSLHEPVRADIRQIQQLHHVRRGRRAPIVQRKFRHQVLPPTVEALLPRISRQLIIPLIYTRAQL